MWEWSAVCRGRSWLEPPQGGGGAATGKGLFWNARMANATGIIKRKHAAKVIFCTFVTRFTSEQSTFSIPDLPRSTTLRFDPVICPNDQLAPSTFIER